MGRKGKRISVRWSKERVQLIKELGWSNLEDGEIIDNALEKSKELMK